jgi:hypothetical protein
MRYIKTYKIFETELDLDSVANEFLNEMSKTYDLRLGKPFDKEKANCAWFTKEFFRWAKLKRYDVKIVYFDSEVEAHIAPIIDNKTIDFAIKQFTKNPNDDYQILSIKDYKSFGYGKSEILNEFPTWATVKKADLLK